MLVQQNVVFSLFICCVSFLMYSISKNPRDCASSTGSSSIALSNSDCLPVCPRRLQLCSTLRRRDQNGCLRSTRSCSNYVFPRENTFLATVESAKVEISWTLSDKVNVTIQRWYFSNFGKKQLLGQIIGTRRVMKDLNSSLPEFEIEKPARLILKKVDHRHNGTYEFSRVENDSNFPYVSYVTLFVAVTRVTSKPEKAVLGHSVTIICETNSRFPPRYVIFHNKTRIYNGTVSTYTIPTVEYTHAGLYECMIENKVGSGSKSYMLTVLVQQPVVTRLTSNPEKAILGQPVTITCETSTRPPPKYSIFHNNTKIYDGPKNTYAIQKVEYSHAGLYECMIENKVGSSSKIFKLTVLDKETTIKPSLSSSGTKWYIYFLLVVSSIIFGAFLSSTFWYLRRRFKKKSECRSEPEQQSNEVDTNYQDLELGRMNLEDNYQSLKGHSAGNDPDYENAPTYTELSDVRDGENNYESLKPNNGH